MKCFRVDLWRKLVRYIDGELPASTVLRIEAHLLDCVDCRSRVARLKRGKRFAESLSPVSHKPDVWPAIEAGINAEAGARKQSSPQPNTSFPVRIRHQMPAFVGGLTVAALLIGIFVLINRRSPLSNEKELQDFQAVKISDIQSNTAPHIFTEGYVSDVKSQEDGDLTFKLVEDLKNPDRFIFCEIINPIRLSAPSNGSFVRVYGVSRYDRESNHNWYEVHPVLNIEPMRP